MKILILSYLPIEPANGGGRVRIRQLATHLTERHDVTMICPPLDRRPERPFPFHLHQIGKRGVRQLVDPWQYRDIVHTIRTERPDIVLAEYIWQGPHAALGRLSHNVRIVLDAFDVVTARFRRTGSLLWPLISAYESSVLRLVDDVIAVSELDRRQLIHLGAPEFRTQIVPNGVDTTEFRVDRSAGRRVRNELGVGAAERLLLFFGQLDYPPNTKAVHALASHVMPRLGREYRLIVAGRGLSPKLRDTSMSERIRFLGPVEHLPAYINAADAVVAPITCGSGTRLKLLESIACGTPTIATSVATEGLEQSVCGPALTVADGWPAFTEAISHAARLERTPPSQAFVLSYDWRGIVGRISFN